MGTPSDSDLRAEINELKAELAALRKLLAVPDGKTFAQVPILAPRFACVQIGRPTGVSFATLGFTDKGGSLHLQNGYGKEVAQLGATPDGGAMVLKTSRERIAVTAWVYEGHGLIEVKGGDGKRRVGISATEKGGMVVVSAPDESPRAAFGAPLGAGDLRIWDKKGREAASILLAEGSPALRLINPENGCTSVIVGELADSESPIGGSIVLFSRTGNRAVELMATNLGGLINLNDRNKKPGIELGVIDEGTRILLRHSDGKHRIQLLGTETGGSIALNDRKGNTAIDLSTLIGITSFAINTNAGTPSLFFTTGESCEASLLLFGANKSRGAAIMTDPFGGHLMLLSESGDSTVLLGHHHVLGNSLIFSKYESEIPQIILTVGNDELTTGLQFYTPDKTPLVTLSAAPTGGELRLYTDLGFERASMCVIDDSAQIILKTAGGSTIQMAAADEDIGLAAYDPQAKPFAVWPGETFDEDEPEE